jgi:hypothetical protein
MTSSLSPRIDQDPAGTPASTPYASPEADAVPAPETVRSERSVTVGKAVERSRVLGGLSRLTSLESRHG